MAAPIYYSAEMVRALPDDGKRYETVHGELLVTPAPRILHQQVVGRLFRALAGYLDETCVGSALLSPADISWGTGILVQPDLFVADRDEIETGEWQNVQTLLLAIEVLSPSTARYDRFTKRRLYQEVGVPLYWIVDPDEQLVEVWIPDDTFPTVERERVAWDPAGAARPFTLEISELFQPD
ncbi:MAG: Uma2 family endonuclease [Gemmatimonadales bacterium]